MTRSTFKKIQDKYGRVGSWAIWNTKTMCVCDLAVIDKSLSKLKPECVFVGLNLSQKIKKDFGNFHRSDTDAKFLHALTKAGYEGAYLTDIIKNRIEPNSVELMKSLKKQEKKQQVAAFERELEALGCKNKLIVAVGNEAYRILRKYLDPKRKYNLKKILHYSNSVRGYGDWDTYAKRVKRDLGGTK